MKLEDFFQLRTATGRRAHSLTILKQHCRLKVRKYFFTHRVVDTWNKMSEDTVNSKTVNRFKNQIDPWFKQHGGLYISQRRLHAPVIQTHGHTATNYQKLVRKHSHSPSVRRGACDPTAEIAIYRAHPAHA